MNSFYLLKKELDWLERVIKVRLEFPKADIENFSIESVASIHSHGISAKTEYDLSLPHFDFYQGVPYYDLVKDFDVKERLLLILALSTHIETGFIDRIINQPHYTDLLDKSPNFYYISGLVSKSNYGFIPTGRFWI